MRKYFLLANSKKCFYLGMILSLYYYGLVYYALPLDHRAGYNIYLGNCSREEM
jgi:hypothetical protein